MVFQAHPALLYVLPVTQLVPAGKPLVWIIIIIIITTTTTTTTTTTIIIVIIVIIRITIIIIVVAVVVEAIVVVIVVAIVVARIGIMSAKQRRWGTAADPGHPAAVQQHCMAVQRRVFPSPDHVYVATTIAVAVINVLVAFIVSAAANHTILKTDCR